VQLAHACAAIGFDVVVPATWGDEIIAFSAAQRAGESAQPVVQCSCPLVARRFAEYDGVLNGMVMRFVSPPVATARYLRALYRGRALRITYAGDCPLPSLDAIDERLSCAALSEHLARRGIDLAVQPTEFDSIIPPDRRRHFSKPGGVPSQQALRRIAGDLELIELASGDVPAEVAQHLLSGKRALLDFAAAVGCRCSGASVDEWDNAQARAQVRAHEPPRAASPVVDHEASLSVSDDDQPAASGPAGYQNGTEGSPEVDAPAEPALVGTAGPPRRRSPAGSTRAVMGTMPLSRSEGRQLPRLYVARRRSSPRGVRQSTLRSMPAEAFPVEPAAEARVNGARATDPSTNDTPARWTLIIVLGIVAGVLLTLALAALG